MKFRLSAMLAAMIIMTGCSEASSDADIPEASADTAANIQTEISEEVTRMTYEIDSTKPLVALTFDDGPNLTTTVKVLDLLEKHQIPASFFLVGNNITDSTAKVVQRAYSLGCEIDNHSKTHSAMPDMTEEDIKAEIEFVSAKVEEITGEPTKFFRPPYIAVNQTMYDCIDMPFICGLGCNDWDPAVTVQERIDKTLEQVKDGSIILLHDSQGNSQTVEALETIIPTLLEEGYQFVTVEDLFKTKGIEISGDDTSLYSVIE